MPILVTEAQVLRLGGGYGSSFLGFVLFRGFLFLFFYRPASTALAATGSKAAQHSATSSVVTDNEPKHTALIPGCRQEKQLTTCHPTWELFLHNPPKTNGKYCHQHVLIAPQRAATLKSIIQSTAC